MENDYHWHWWHWLILIAVIILCLGVGYPWINNYKIVKTGEYHEQQEEKIRQSSF